MKNIRRAVLIMAALATVAVAGSDAQAGKTAYSGLVCVERNDTTPELVYDIFGAARNTAGSGQLILCPIDRHDVNSSMDVIDWDITTDRNGNSAAAWDVILYSADTAGDNGFASTITVPGNPSDGAHDEDGGSITSAWLDGTMFVETTIPAGAELRRISVNEG